MNNFSFQLNFLLPTNLLSLRSDSLYCTVEQNCGTEAMELLKFQLIDSSMNLLEVDDVFFYTSIWMESNDITERKFRCCRQEWIWQLFILRQARNPLETWQIYSFASFSTFINRFFVFISCELSGAFIWSSSAISILSQSYILPRIERIDRFLIGFHFKSTIGLTREHNELINRFLNESKTNLLSY